MVRLADPRTQDEGMRDLERLWRPRILLVANRILHDRDAAEDALQDVFKRLLKVARSGRYDPDGNFGAYVTRITKNRCLTMLKQKARSFGGAPTGDFGPGVEDDVDNVASIGRTAEEVASSRELESYARRQLAFLPERQAEALRLLADEGLEPAEVGKRLGIPAGTLRRYRHEIRASLIRTLSEELASSVRPSAGLILASRGTARPPSRSPEADRRP